MKKMFLLPLIFFGSLCAMETINEGKQEEEELPLITRSPESLQKIMGSAFAYSMLDGETLNQFIKDPNTHNFPMMQTISNCNKAFSNISTQLQNIAPLLKWQMALASPVKFDFDESFEDADISYEGGLIVVCFENGTKIYDINTKELKQTIPFSGYKASFSPDGKKIALDIDDTKIIIWDLENQSIIKTILCDHSKLLRYINDDEIIISCPGKLIFWDLNGNKISKEFECNGGEISLFNQNGKKYLVRGGRDTITDRGLAKSCDTIKIWDVESQKVVKFYRLNDETENLHYSFAQNKVFIYKAMFFHNEQKPVMVFDLITGSQYKVKDDISRLCKNDIGLGLDNGKLLLYDLLTKKKIKGPDFKIFLQPTYISVYPEIGEENKLRVFQNRKHLITYDLKRNYFENLNFYQLQLILYMHTNFDRLNYGIIWDHKLLKIYNSLPENFKSVFPLQMSKQPYSAKYSPCDIV
ncbi:hypothetical protein M1446_02450 [Candidatus Dependentiae bacterium]|nr:hypothetical protein [Candidatus Dependentiae bacterium]